MELVVTVESVAVEEPLKTGFRATMGKFCVAKSAVEGAVERKPNPDTGRPEAAGVAELDVFVSADVVADAEETAAFAAAEAAAAFDFRTPLARGRGP